MTPAVGSLGTLRAAAIRSPNGEQKKGDRPRERPAAACNDVGTMTLRSALLALVTAALLSACDEAPKHDPVWGAWEAPAAGCNARTAF